MNMVRKSMILILILSMVIVGLPLLILIGPMASIVMIVVTLIVLSRGVWKHGSPKKLDKQKQDDELVTVILPVINNNY